ncbi:unnamed protein product [Leptidea sinapis]|uniref:Uncharacterized protein n=1 Tax=Leptidea sinapis TaxID=189913 RepID=A0A5E4R885_9NEOP|nr:unnamed protein product [Leptidea sinapis]
MPALVRREVSRVLLQSAAAHIAQPVALRALAPVGTAASTSSTPATPTTAEHRLVLVNHTHASHKYICSHTFGGDNDEHRASPRPCDASAGRAIGHARPKGRTSGR